MEAVGIWVGFGMILIGGGSVGEELVGGVCGLAGKLGEVHGLLGLSVW